MKKKQALEIFQSPQFKRNCSSEFIVIKDANVNKV